MNTPPPSLDPEQPLPDDVATLQAMVRSLLTTVAALQVEVAELPPLRPHVTEYRLYARRCAACGKRTWAALPPSAPRRCVGPRAQAVLALLAGAGRLSRRQMQSLAQEVFGIGLSLGTVAALEADTASALATPYQELAPAVVQEPVLFVDETGCPLGAAGSWGSALALDRSEPSLRLLPAGSPPEP